MYKHILNTASTQLNDAYISMFLVHNMDDTNKQSNSLSLPSMAITTSIQELRGHPLSTIVLKVVAL